MEQTIPLSSQTGRQIRPIDNKMCDKISYLNEKFNQYHETTYAFSEGKFIFLEIKESSQSVNHM